MNKKKQMSETIRLGMLLALSGGLMDSYSYIEREHVFANAQTGNLLLFGVNLSEGNYEKALHYIVPVLAFALGIALAEVFRAKNIKMLHWRQFSVLFEAVILFGVAFIPLTINIVANSLISFACGIQVESFRKIHGNGIATTMCIGNMRSGTELFCKYIQLKKTEYLKKSLLYFGIIMCFIIGAVTGNFLIQYFGQYAIMVSSGILMIAFLLMFKEYETENESSCRSV